MASISYPQGVPGACVAVIELDFGDADMADAVGSVTGVTHASQSGATLTVVFFVPASASRANVQDILDVLSRAGCFRAGLHDEETGARVLC